MTNKLILILRVSISALFLLSVFAKLYPTPLYGITKVFEEGQLIPMGFNESLVPYLSRFIIAIELFIAVSILQNNYLKKIIIPGSILLLIIFSIHLAYQIFSGINDNCGCFGELIPMTPLQAFVKNLLTIIVLLFIYNKFQDKGENNSFVNLYVKFISIVLLIFMFIPVSSVSNNSAKNFISYVDSDEFRDFDGKKILCFFDAGCEHCQDVASSLDSLSKISSGIFPNLHIIFSDTEKDNIPNFFNSVGREFSYQIMPFANYDTDEIDSYMEITFPDYDNPVVILYDGNKQIRLYDGVGDNEFHADELRSILE